MNRSVALAIGLFASTCVVAIIYIALNWHPPVRIVKLSIWMCGALGALAVIFYRYFLYERPLPEDVAKRVLPTLIQTIFGEIVDKQAPLVKSGRKSEIIRCVCQYWRITQSAQIDGRAARRTTIARRHIESHLRELVLDGRIRYVVDIRFESIEGYYRLSCDPPNRQVEAAANDQRAVPSAISPRIQN